MTKKEIQADMLNEYMCNMDLWWMLKQAGETEAATRYHKEAALYESMLKKYFSIDAFQLWLDQTY